MRFSSKIWVFLMIISIIGFILPASSVKGTQEHEITGLSCLVYPDGSAKIEYRVEVDPVAARMNINLLGKEFDDLVKSFLKASVPDIGTPPDIAIATILYIAADKFSYFIGNIAKTLPYLVS